jgi:hypothetical protein
MTESTACFPITKPNMQPYRRIHRHNNFKVR